MKSRFLVIIFLSYRAFSFLCSMYPLFYISPYEEDWEMDYQSIVENYQYTYGLNETDPFLSEFGEIKFKNMFGGLVKQ